MEYEERKVLFASQWGPDWSQILRSERIRRNVSQERLCAGLLDRRALANMENGIAGWAKVVGDVLLQRLGIYPGHFECMVTEEELFSWRDREEICRCIFSDPPKARKRIEEMERHGENRNAVERQFLEKMKTVELIRDGAPGERVKRQAERAVSCTIPADWKENSDTILLAPLELEAILLLAMGELLLDHIERAMALQQWVWNYPREHGWKRRMEELILPAAAWVGIQICRKAGDMELGYDMGRTAVELLSRMISQRYLYPLLCEMDGWEPRQEEDKAWSKILRDMKVCLESLYEEFQKPALRLWQTVTMAYTYSASDVLFRLRKAVGKPLEGAVSDEWMEDIISPRQLARVESGRSHITEKNCKRLIRQYGRTPSLRNSLTVTDSLRVLQMSREVSRLIYLTEWDDARKLLMQWAEAVDLSHPVNKQFFLSKEAIIELRQGVITGEACIRYLELALSCTVPQFSALDLKFWPFQREEVIIINNIAARYEQIDQRQTALTWLGYVGNAMEYYRSKYGVLLSTYDLVVLNEVDITGNLGEHQKAVTINTERTGYLFDSPSLTCLGNMLYDRAWNRYEIGSKMMGEKERLKAMWQKDYVRSVQTVTFFQDHEYLVFLKTQERKFLS